MKIGKPSVKIGKPSAKIGKPTAEIGKTIKLIEHCFFTAKVEGVNGKPKDGEGGTSTICHVSCPETGLHPKQEKV